MIKRNKKRLVIGILCCLLVIMGVGYAILSQTLNINTTAKISGSFNIYIQDISIAEPTDGAQIKNGTFGINSDRLSANTTVNFNAPGEFIIYNIKIKNAGTIDAILTDIKKQISSENNNYFTIEEIGIEKGFELASQKEKDFSLKITFDKDKKLESLTNMTCELTLQLIFNQAGFSTSGSGSGSIDIPSDETPDFTLDNDGTIIAYDESKIKKDSDGYLVVPSTNSEGKQIKAITKGSFEKYNIAQLFDNDGGEDGIIIFDTQNYDDIVSKIKVLPSDSIIFDGLDPSEIIFYKPGDTSIPSDAGYVNFYLDLATGNVEEAPLVSNKVDLSGAIYLKTIKVDSFADKPLESIKLNEGLERIEEGAFCFSHLTSIKFPSTLKYIGVQAFDNEKNDYKLTGEVIIPSSVEEIGGWAFGVNNISELTFEGASDNTANIKTIGYNAFLDNKITSLVIPKSVTTIGSGAFSGNLLTDITVKKNKSDCTAFYVGSGQHDASWYGSFDADKINYLG